ncbi:helix-turn-helix transcriptional regulator [Salinisphaera sp. G21_0]|uniref:helix-turn-helix domain-containing protein n=1 Tax=Salinisphaera sp. G21_0 TaxID=2821094 RepID=UPI001ADCF06F|nr:helix-turn-helix transcriptional regulator [Salinisphaera sp. G21_0]MBO9483808.1 helix-turn-helix transcriptional regulator [Salinisphaera sp. G21_0]
MRRTFGGRLRLARLEIKASQSHMARKVGVDSSTWNRWEHNKSHPGMKDLKKITERFGFSLDWLVMGVDTRSDVIGRLIFLLSKLRRRELQKIVEWAEVRCESDTLSEKN